MLDVDASWNSIGDAGCKALSNFLREIGQPVQSLKLLNNHIGSDGASALACLVNKVAVHELHLSHNRIGPDGMVRILKSLAVSPTYPLDVPDVTLTSSRSHDDKELQEMLCGGMRQTSRPRHRVLC